MKNRLRYFATACMGYFALSRFVWDIMRPSVNAQTFIGLVIWSGLAIAIYRKADRFSLFFVGFCAFIAAAQTYVYKLGVDRGIVPPQWFGHIISIVPLILTSISLAAYWVYHQREKKAASLKPQS